MPQRPTEPVDPPNQHSIELPAMCISHEAVELRSALTGTRHTFINVFGYDLPPSQDTILSQLRQLHLRVLSVHRANAGIQTDPHAASPVTAYPIGAYTPKSGRGKHATAACSRLSSGLKSPSHTKHQRNKPWARKTLPTASIIRKPSYPLLWRASEFSC
jgi:hypothetical protein